MTTPKVNYIALLENHGQAIFQYLMTKPMAEVEALVAMLRQSRKLEFSEEQITPVLNPTPPQPDSLPN